MKPTTIATPATPNSKPHARRCVSGSEKNKNSSSAENSGAAELRIASVLALPLAAPELAQGTWGTKVIVALLVLSLACTTFASWLFYGLIARTGPVVTMSAMYLLPAFSLLWGWLFLNETIAPLQLAGFGVVVIALLLVAGRRQAPVAAR